jgi:energy-coupling factor transporter ATP-binding protein EcfA2
VNSGKVLELQDISYRDILKGINLSWRQGQILALMGSNGAGKSTLARLIAGLAEPGTGEIRLTREGKYYPWNTVKRWHEIGLIGQHPRRQTIGATVAEELGFGLFNLGMDTQTVRAKVDQLVEQMGLKGKENQSPSSLSGGERQRLVTAAILALQPSFLILDEGLSMLDAHAQASVLQLLIEVRNETGQLWITHDEELARKADRLLVLDKGKLIDWGVPNDAFRNYPEELSAYYSNGLHIHNKVKHYRSKANDQALIDRRPILEWKSAELDNRLIIDKKIEVGEFVAIVGPSGSGKTTLLESIAGFIKLTKGKLFAYGESLDRNGLEALRQKTGYVLQEAGEYLIGSNVSQEVFFHERKQSLKILNQEQINYMKQYKLPVEMANIAPEFLSGGERQKVALAAAMRMLPEILLLDEPLLGLDTSSKATIQQLIYNLKGITILFVTHDLRDVLGAADRIWLVEKGRITLDCPVQEWREHQDQFRSSGVRF